MSDDNRIWIGRHLAIPEHELQFEFSPSGGPGGQHANRSATRVTLVFDVAGSPSLNPAQRERLRARLAARLDSQGVLRLSVQDTRSQHQNRQLAISRLQRLLATALRTPRRRRPTAPSRAAREKRLQAKKRRGKRKKERRRRWEPD